MQNESARDINANKAKKRTVSDYIGGAYIKKNSNKIK